MCNPCRIERLYHSQNLLNCVTYLIPGLFVAKWIVQYWLILSAVSMVFAYTSCSLIGLPLSKTRTPWTMVWTILSRQSFKCFLCTLQAKRGALSVGPWFKTVCFGVFTEWSQVERHRSMIRNLLRLVFFVVFEDRIHISHHMLHTEQSILSYCSHVSVFD